MLYEIKRIPPGPVLKVAFFVFLIVGFIIGLFYGLLIMSFLSSMSGMLGMGDQFTSEFSAFGLFGLIIMGVVMSIFSSIIMTIITGLSVVCYNMIASWLGGLEIDLQKNRLYLYKQQAERQQLQSDSNAENDPLHEEDE